MEEIISVILFCSLLFELSEPFKQIVLKKFLD